MKVIIIASSKFSSGGTESLHQLADGINNSGGKAYLFFYDNPQKKIEEKFEKYRVTSIDYIEDEIENIVVIPETLTFLMGKIKKARIVIWWLSLDFYIKTNPLKGCIYRCKENKVMYLTIPVMFCYLLAKRSTNFRVYTKKNEHRVYAHLYNCEYVADYLRRKGIKEKKLYYLCGPINEDFVNKVNNSLKRNIVIYNPEKGMKFTRKIVEKLQDKNILCIPLRNMSRDDVHNIMSIAKVYIDFGFFPGPERVPREAVVNKCNILVALEGSARNRMDFPIHEEFKMEKKKKNIDRISDKVIQMLDNYDEDLGKFDAYRTKVLNQKTLFDEKIKKLNQMWEIK